MIGGGVYTPPYSFIPCKAGVVHLQKRSKNEKGEKVRGWTKELVSWIIAVKILTIDGGDDIMFKYAFYLYYV